MRRSRLKTNTLNILGLLALLIGALSLAVPATLLAEEPKPKKEEKPKDAAAPAEAADESGAAKDKEEKEEEEEAKDRFFAVTGAVIHTITDGDIVGATILAKNGRIHRIGREIVLPEDTETLDATGYHLYPGFVAVQSANVLGSEPPADTTNVYLPEMAIALAGGITTAVSGNTAAKLTFGTTEDMVVKADLFENISYSSSKPGDRRKLRAAFEKVRQYVRDVEAWEEKKKTAPEAEEPDKKWIKGQHQTCLKLLKREAVALVDADEAQDILDICDLAKRFGFSVVVSGATEGWTVASQMAGVDLSTIITPREDVPADERLNRPNGSSIENAAILHRHGVRLAIVPGTAAITTWGLAGRDLLHLNMEAAFAVRGGLSEDAALRAITIDAARVLGIDHRVGSIEIGKDADFAIVDGDPLHYMTHARWTIVNGRVAYDKAKDTLFNHIRPEGDQDAPPPDDYWPRRLGADQ